MKNIFLSTLLLTTFPIFACYENNSDKGHDFSFYHMSVNSMTLTHDASEFFIEKAKLVDEYDYLISQDKELSNYNIDLVNINELHGYNGIKGHKSFDCNNHINCLKTAIKDFETQNKIVQIYIFNGQNTRFWFDILSENSYETYYLYNNKIEKLLF